MKFGINNNRLEAVNAMAKKHKNLSLEGDKYIIRPFKDWEDFLNEGKTLNHAVHYYALNQYAKGTDYLFAMRRKDAPEMPFITLEFDTDGILKQARKLNNFLVKEKEEYDFIECFRKLILVVFIATQLKESSLKYQIEQFCKEFLNALSENSERNDFSLNIVRDGDDFKIVYTTFDGVDYESIVKSEFPYYLSFLSLIKTIPLCIKSILTTFENGKLKDINFETQ